MLTLPYPQLTPFPSNWQVVLDGGNLRLHEYEERGLIRMVPIHDGRSRESLWLLYCTEDQVFELGMLGSWLGWLRSGGVMEPASP